MRALTALMVLPVVLLSLGLLGMSVYVMIEQGDTSFGTLFGFGSAVPGSAPPCVGALSLGGA